MSWLEWTLYRLKTALQRSKPRINVSPPDFPANNIGVWLDAHQYNVLVGKDPDAVPVKSTIPKEMVFMPPDVSEACDEGYAV